MDKSTKKEIDQKVSLQEFLDNLLIDIGDPLKWTQKEASTFYKEMMHSEFLGNQRLILQVDEVKGFSDHTWITAIVLNPEDYKPFRLAFQDKEYWTVSFRVSNDDQEYFNNEILLAIGEELRLDSVKDSKRNELIFINGKYVQRAEYSQLLEIYFGKNIIQMLIERFNSLEKIAPFIISSLESIIEDDIDRLIKSKDNKELEIEAKHNKKINELIASLNEKEIKLRESYNQMESELQELIEKNEIEKKKIISLEKYIKKQEQELKQRKEFYEKELIRLKKYENILASQFEKLSLLHPVLAKEENQYSTTNTINWSEQKDIINTIRGALYAQCNLYYSRETIEAFVGSLINNQITILYGTSGTGKSSLVEGFSKVMANSKTFMISVQSSWTDKEDLLGFLNPLEFQYISTPFLDALVEARKNPEWLYLICLDELNLAHIEYYFAEFLSGREKDVPSITLYSKRFQELAYERIKNYVIKDELGQTYLNEEKIKELPTSEKLRLQNCLDLVYLYPAEFHIPGNVRFIGTMNMDHTVKGLSPKTIDRSFVIELESPDDESLKSELEEIKVPQKIILNLAEDLRPTLFNKEIKEEIITINPILAKLNAKLNKRALEQIGYFSGSVFSENVFNIVIKGKVLPRINVIRNSENENAFNKLIEVLKVSDRTKNRMKAMLDYNHSINYWR
jgi:energy-coupling factor transporter ATP-binding protein EcfA2